MGQLVDRTNGLVRLYRSEVYEDVLRVPFYDLFLCDIGVRELADGLCRVIGGVLRIDKDKRGVDRLCGLEPVRAPE